MSGSAGLGGALLATIQLSEGARRVSCAYAADGGAAAAADAIKAMTDGRRLAAKNRPAPPIDHS